MDSVDRPWRVEDGEKGSKQLKSHSGEVELCTVMIRRSRRLKRMARGAHEVAQYRDIGTVSADAARIDREAEALSEIEIHARIVEFGQAETRRGSNAVHAGGIDRPRWPVALPRPASEFVELLPVTFVPSVHRSSSPF